MMNNIPYQLSNLSSQYVRAAASANTPGEKTFLLVVGIVAIVGIIAGAIYCIYKTHF